jgi:ATP-dependent DNA helicase RecG
MNIVDGPPEYTKPRNVGLLFFSMEPEKFFPYSTRIDVVELPDGEGGDRIFEHAFSGPLHQQLREALGYLKNNVIEEVVVKLPDRAEAERFYNYPYAALEEALANAVYHKGYDTREPIEVRVLPDRIEVLSHPGADRSITIANLREYRAVSRRYRNRRVGDFLKELHLTEGRNTGIHKMLRALANNGSPKPLLETDEDRLYFLATLYARRLDTAHMSTLSEKARMTSERREQLLAFFSEHPTSTMAEAGIALGVARSTVSRDISELRLLGRLVREGPTKGGKWIVT